MAYTPKDITRDADNGLELASFDYYNGIDMAKERGLKQTGSFQDVRDGKHFIVCCGDVMVAVTSEEYPKIQRRLI